MKTINEQHNTQLNNLKNYLRTILVSGVSVQGEFITNNNEQFAAIKFFGIIGLSQPFTSGLINVNDLSNIDFCISKIRKDVKTADLIEGTVFIQ